MATYSFFHCCCCETWLNNESNEFIQNGFEEELFKLFEEEDNSCEGIIVCCCWRINGLIKLVGVTLFVNVCCVNGGVENSTGVLKKWRVGLHF